MDERKEKFTPWIWEYAGGNDNYIVYSRMYGNIANTFFDIHAPRKKRDAWKKELNKATCRANACLISAAPEMYQSLKIGTKDLLTAASMLPDVREALLKTVEQMQAAMAKARGE